MGLDIAEESVRTGSQGGDRERRIHEEAWVRRGGSLRTQMSRVKAPRCGEANLVERRGKR
jgi:hypothetical protein